SSRRRHTRWPRDWSSDVCSSDLKRILPVLARRLRLDRRPESLAHPRLGVLFDTAADLELDLDQRRLVVGAGEIGVDLRDPLADRSEERRVGKEWSLRVARGSRRR